MMPVQFKCTFFMINNMALKKLWNLKQPGLMFQNTKSFNFKFVFYFDVP